jgi:hypothetical protein
MSETETQKPKIKTHPLYKRWVVDKRGRRKYGTREFMRQLLESNTDAMLKHLRGDRSSLNDISATMYAIRAAHWALALKGK